MGYIKFKTFYTELVEHFLRLAVRHSQLTKANPSSVRDWHVFTKYWLICNPKKIRNLSYLFLIINSALLLMDCVALNQWKYYIPNV